ncbi:MAG: hypothetical protein MJ252_22165 [archaeon]|nr:hypothetical protein [archaeon]
MNHRIFCYFLILFLSLENIKCSPWDDYDFYVLAVQWGSTLCKTEGTICYEKLKKVPKYQMNIHGLWPSMLSGETLPDCNQDKEIPIVAKENSTVFQFMRKYWPSLKGEDETFWGHEYNKHGYCYNMRYDYTPEDYEKYFQKATTVFWENEIASLITDALGGDEDGEYAIDREDLTDYMDNKYGENTYSLRCTRIGGDYYLGEIRFRLDLDFNLTTDGKSQDSCPKGKLIHLQYWSGNENKIKILDEKENKKNF